MDPGQITMGRREAPRLPERRRATQEWRASGAPSPFSSEGADLNTPRGESVAREKESGCVGERQKVAGTKKEAL